MVSLFRFFCPDVLVGSTVLPTLLLPSSLNHFGFIVLFRDFARAISTCVIVDFINTRQLFLPRANLS